MIKRLLIILYLLCFSTNLLAKDQVLIYALDNDPPWEYFNNKNTATGIDIEIMNIISTKLKLKIQYQKFPFKRSLFYMKAGKIDIMGYLSYRRERIKYMTFIEPAYMSGTKIFFIKKGQKVNINKYSDLYNYKIGLKLGSKHFDAFDNDKKIKKFTGVGNQDLLKMLLTNNIDAFITNYTTGVYYVYQKGFINKLEIAQYKIKLKKNGFFAISNKSKHYDRIDEIEKELSLMVKNGEVDKIIDNYVNKYLKK